MMNQIKNIGVLVAFTIASIGCTPEPLSVENLPIQKLSVDKLSVQKITVEKPSSILSANPQELISTVPLVILSDYSVFEWRAPECKNPVYRLKIWQQKVGQNALTAIQENAPILIKNLDNTNISITPYGFKAEIDIVPTNAIVAPYTSDFCFLIETFDGNGNRIMRANSYRYSRSNKQKG
jgi:hypothetical protein